MTVRESSVLGGAQPFSYARILPRSSLKLLLLIDALGLWSLGYRESFVPRSPKAWFIVWG